MYKNIARLSFALMTLVLMSCNPSSPAPAATSVPGLTPGMPTTLTPGVPTIPAPGAQTTQSATFTVLPQLSAIISSANANNLVEVARWGLGSGHHPTYSADGGLLAVSSSSGIYLYDSKTYQESIYFPQVDIHDMAFSPDGKTLSAVSDTFYVVTVKQWDLASSSELHSWSVDKNPQLNQSVIDPIAALSPDGRTAAISFDENTVKLWDVVSGKELHSLSMRFAVDVAFSPDGKTLASAVANQVTLWNVSSGSQLRTLDTAPENISLAFSPDGRTLAVGADNSDWNFADNNTTLWDVTSGLQLQSFKSDLPFSMATVAAFGLAFSPDGKELASGTARGTSVKLWEAASGNELHSLNVSNLESLAFSPDGKTLVSVSSVGEDPVKLWDAATGNQVNSLKGDNVSGKVIFSPDSRTLAYASDDFTVRLRDVTSGEVRILSGHPSYVSGLAFSPDSKTLASGSAEDQLSPGINILKLWDVVSGSELHTLNGHSGGVTGVVFSPDGKTLASGSIDQTIKLWEAASGSELRTLSGHTSMVYGVAFSPDGKTLASGSWDQTVKLWDAASGKELRTLSGHTSELVNVIFSPDGKELVSWSYTEIKLWEAASGKELHTFGWAPDPYTEPGIAFSPDGKTLAIGYLDGTIKLLDPASGQELASWSGGTQAVSGLAFSPDGKILASGAGDKINLWEVSSGKELSNLDISNVTSLAFSPDGKFILSRSFYSMVRLWGVHP